MSIWRNLEDAPEGAAVIFWIAVAVLFWSCVVAGAVLWRVLT